MTLTKMRMNSQQRQAGVQRQGEVQRQGGCNGRGGCNSRHIFGVVVHALAKDVEIGRETLGGGGLAVQENVLDSTV